MAPVEGGEGGATAAAVVDTCVYSISASSATLKDSGQWRCEVTNDYGKSTSDFSVKVLDKKNIEEADPPKFTETFGNILIDEEDNATFKCSAVGKPTPAIKWFRNEIPIEEGRPGMEQFKMTDRDGYQTLKIKRATKHNAGIYKCKASNVAGWATCDAKLYVKESKSLELFSFSKSHEYSLVDQIKARRTKPDSQNEADTLVRFHDSETINKFLLKWKVDADQTLGFFEHLKSKCGVEGTQSVLSCLVRGIAPFKVRWYKNNQEIFDGNKYFIRNQRGILSMEIPCTTEKDTGNYMVEVRNTQGKIFSSCYLQVEPVLDLTNEVPTKPEFVKPMKRLTVNEGELIRFRVTVKAHPAPGFKWYKDGLEIHDNERITTEVRPKGVAQLVIEHSTTRDIGLYTCEAHNMAGRAKSMVRISVRDKFDMEAWQAQCIKGGEAKTEGKYDTPQNALTNGVDPLKIDYIPRQHSEGFTTKPIFSHMLPHTVTIRDRGRFILECCCNAVPTPKAQWYKDDKLLHEGVHYNFLSLGDWFGLEIVEGEISDTGTYMIKIKNEKGEVTSSCDVEMKLPMVQAKSLKFPAETALDISKRSDRCVAAQSEEIRILSFADLNPSDLLCNTERDWTAYVEKEVEVVEAEESPSFPDVLPDKVTPMENAENVELVCKVQGNPLPRVVWFKDDKQLDEGSEGFTLTFDKEARRSILTIKKLTAKETGKYSCVAYSEGGGHATSTTEVQFRGDTPDKNDSTAATAESTKEPGAPTVEMKLPEFKVKLEDTQAKPGSKVKLEVVTEGCPKPEIQWFKNDQQITQNMEKYSFKNSEDGSHALVISGMHVSDADCYKCVAVNECGTVSTCAHVFVQEASCAAGSDAGKERPSFMEPLHSITTRIKDDVYFKCIANGIPTPTLTWQKDSKPLTASKRFVIKNREGESALTIKKVTAEDAGLYVCVAENDQGKVESCSSLQVIGDFFVGPDDVNGANGQTSNGVIANGMSNQIIDPNDVSINERLGSSAAAAAAGGSVKATKEYAILKRPKFLSRPTTQWVIADEELFLSVELAKAENITVNWYHNGQLIQNGRFKLETKSKAK